MTDGTHGEHCESAGAYLLGALPELERQAFERHLMSCSACREEVERLRPAAEALPRSVTPLAAPAGLKRSVMAGVAEEAGDAPAASGAGRARPWRRLRRRAEPLRGRLRPAAAWASAAFLLAAGVAAGLGAGELLGGADERRVAGEVDSSRLAEGSGTLLVPEGEDHAILSVHGLPTLPAEDSSQIYQTWLLRGNEVIPAPVFGVDAEGAGSATVTEGVEGADAVWVTREPAGGSRAPSEEPVMRFPLD